MWGAVHFILRWGELESFENIPRNDIIWLPLVEKRLTVAKDVKGTVEALSSICYPERFETFTPQCVADKLILCPDDPLFKFVEEELQDLAFMSLWNLDRLVCLFFFKSGLSMN